MSFEDVLKSMGRAKEIPNYDSKTDIFYGVISYNDLNVVKWITLTFIKDIHIEINKEYFDKFDLKNQEVINHEE